MKKITKLKNEAFKKGYTSKYERNEELAELNKIGVMKNEKDN